MPRYDALIHPGTYKSEYQEAREAFKRVCAGLFSGPRRLDPSDFYGPSEPRESDDLPEGTQVVFVLFLDIEGRDYDSNKRDDAADLVARQVLVHSGIHVRVELEFLNIGWSFLKTETLPLGLTAHISDAVVEMLMRGS